MASKPSERDEFELGRTHVSGLPEGTVPSYLPYLGRHLSSAVGYALVNRETAFARATGAVVTLQSCAKPLLLLAALQKAGTERVAAAVGAQYSPFPFNAKQLGSDNRPHSAMVNLGAFRVAAILAELGFDVQAHIEGLNTHLATELEVAIPEAGRAYQVAKTNLELFDFLLAQGLLPQDADRDQILGIYYHACFIEGSLVDIARLYYFLWTALAQESLGARFFRESIFVGGLYESSLPLQQSLAYPVKSSVSGLLAGLTRRGTGFVIHANGLDSQGNSARGMQMLRCLLKREVV